MPSKVRAKEHCSMANKDAVKKYQEAHDFIKLRPTSEEGAAIRAAAAAAGMSVQGYVLKAVREQMKKEQDR